MSNDDPNTRPLRIGDPVRLKDSDLDLRGAVWQLRTGRYVVVRWEDEWRSTHAATAIELDESRSPPQRTLELGPTPHAPEPPASGSDD